MSSEEDRPGIDYAYFIIRPHVDEDHMVGRLLTVVRNTFQSVMFCGMLSPSADVREKLEAEYAEHKDKDFFEPLIESMLEAPIYIIRVNVGDWQKPAYRALRDLVGPTDPKKAPPGTLRAIFGRPNGPLRYNAVHAPDSVEANISFEERWIKQKKTN